MHILEDSYRHKGLRRQLVRLLREKGIRDEGVLGALANVPRHLFMDSAFVEHAYQDKPFSIGEGQTISQPYTVAFQTQLLEVRKGDRVLEIGTGSGYQASVLAEMGAAVITIERNEVLYARAERLLRLLGYPCRHLLADGSLGYPSHAPYQKILVTAGAPQVPETLLEQLDIGGTLVIPVGSNFRQTMLRIVKLDTKRFSKEEHGVFQFVKLIGKSAW